MPQTLRGLFMFAVMATLTVIVGTLVYNKIVTPMVNKLKAAA